MFADRIEAGRQLGKALRSFAHRHDVIVLGLPRGGVPVAYEVARELDADLDIIVVRKLGHPKNPELAFGAIASGGVRYLNESVRVSDEILEMTTRQELGELHRREQLYRGERPYPDLSNRCVILVDDGLATGATMRSAVRAVRQRNPAQVIVAIPVAPEDTLWSLQREVDQLVCLMIPETFFAVGEFYRDFAQTSDEVVEGILRRSWRQREARAARQSDEHGNQPVEEDAPASGTSGRTAH